MMNSFLRSSQFSLRFTQRLKSLALALLCACALCFQFTASARLSADSLLTQESNQLEFFEKQVRPILARNCQSCHNATAKVAGLDLTSAEAFARGGESGPVFSKANPAESRLLKAISYQETLKMPPVGRLKDEEIAALTVWVKIGAPWPAASLTEANDAKRANKTTVRAFTEAEKAFWSFQPMRRPSAPRVKNSAWVSSPLDAFILQKLEEKNLRPAPPADKLTLLRRATFDLTGLPPTETEIREFLADNSADAFKKVVERLLRSPRYGERWGRHWLDVARYADSTGNDEDHRYPFAWKYRDYVIESFNRDLPYDQFVREQVAGDLLPATDSSGVNRRGIIATGFLALGPKAVAQQDKKKMLYDVYDEQVDVTTKAFLGLTLSCARCHNHKFDPLLTRDYYSMLGIFASTRSFTDPDSHVSVVLEKPLVSKTEWEQYQAGRKEHQAKEKRARLAIEEITDSVREPAAKQRAARLADFMLAARMVYHDGKPLAEIARQMNLSEELLKKWVEYLKPQELTPQHLLEWRNAPADKLAEAAKNYQQRFDHRLTAWLEAVSKWRAEYQKAISDRNSSLPDKPKFEPGEDRFFDDVYFNRSGPLVVSEKDQAQFSPEQWRQLTQLQQELEQLKKSAPAEPELACAIEEGEMVAQKVFIRGDYNNPGEDAPPGFPAILARDDHKPAFTGNGRLQLAEWLTQAEHPLTARVMANRIWQWHFGEGLVRTPDNFGRMGERPTHPELLDYLARAFISSGWSVKAMHRMIMLSSAYQMSSVNPQLSSDADPDNRLLTRFNRRRLSVEEMRDGLLSLDGALDLTMGGTLQQGRGTDGENNQGRLSLNPEKLNRRTVYLPLRRANLPTLLNLFDFGDATSATGKRQLTNVATQALFWLNSDFLTEHSGNLAKQLATQPTLTEAARIERAYLRILNRQPDKNEITQAQQYVAGFRGKFAGENSEQRAWQSFCRALMASNDFIYVD
jgi:hypothetical protein